MILATPQELNPRIYIACLASYNNGILHGKWIDAEQSESELYDAIQKILASSPIPDAEEWAIHDYEDFGGISIGEYESIPTIVALTNLITEHGELGAKLYAHYSDLEYTLKMLDEQYYGCYESEADYAMELTEQTSDIPEHLSCYIDYDRMVTDWKYSGDIDSFEINGEYHIFMRC